MRPISRWWKYLFSRVSAACGALTPCSRRFMDEPPRKSGGAEVRGEYVMKSTRSEETSMSVLDDYLVDPKVSLLSKTLIRGVGPHIGAANDNQASLLVKVKSANDNHDGTIAGEREDSLMEAVKDWSHLYEAERRARHAERPGFRISELQIGPRQQVPWHYHNNVQDTFYVLEGRLRLFLREPK